MPARRPLGVARAQAFLIAAAFMLAAAPRTADAREEATREIVDSVEPSGKVASDLGFVTMPIPQSNPTLGTGLILPLLLLYDPGGKGRPWMTGLGGMYTDNGSWAVGALQKAYLNDDKFRVTGVLGYADLNLKFYGVGSGAGKQGISVPIEQSGVFAMAEGLGEVAHATFIGLRYRLLGVETRLGGQELPGLKITVPTVQLRSTSALLGPVAQYDTRDNELNPARGTYATLSAGFARSAWGSDADYRKVTLAYNHYFPLDKGLIAVRVSVCGADGNVPFYDLCLFGAHNDLRGYVVGQYRDKAMYAAQAEYRRPLFDRFGFVAFAGVGSVANSFGSFNSDNLLPSIGVGARYMASKKYRVNVSMDYAVGRDFHGLYFYIGEAF